MRERSGTLLKRSLVGIVTSLTGGRNFGSRFWCWAPVPPAAAAPPPALKPITKGAKGITGTQETSTTSTKHPLPKKVAAESHQLSVQAWLSALAIGEPDQIAICDKAFGEPQIGALGNKVETLIGNNKLLCPIMEFHGVHGNFPLASLITYPNFMQDILQRTK